MLANTLSSFCVRIMISSGLLHEPVRIRSKLFPVFFVDGLASSGYDKTAVIKGTKH